MGLGWYAVILAVIAAVAVPVTLIIDGRRERRRFDAEIAASEGRIEANRAGRHRMSRPRAGATLPAAGRDPHPHTTAPRPVGRYQPSMSGQFVPNRARPHVSAADLRPVWWTEPGRPQAAPSKHGAPETGRMIRLESATTGEIRAVGDRLVAAIEAGEI